MWMDIGQTSDDSNVHARKKGENQIYWRRFLNMGEIMR